MNLTIHSSTAATFPGKKQLLIAGFRRTNKRNVNWAAIASGVFCYFSSLFICNWTRCGIDWWSLASASCSSIKANWKHSLNATRLVNRKYFIWNGKKRQMSRLECCLETAQFRLLMFLPMWCEHLSWKICYKATLIDFYTWSWNEKWLKVTAE